MRPQIAIAVAAITASVAAPAAAQVVNGGKFQSSNSPGCGGGIGLKIGPGGISSFLWQIDDPGPSPHFPNAPGVFCGTSSTPGSSDYGWSGFMADQEGVVPFAFTWTATTTSPFKVTMQTLLSLTTVGNDVLGPMQNFDPDHSYTWEFVSWFHKYSGPATDAALDASTVFDTTDGPFANALNPQGNFGWHLVDNSPNGGHLDLTYTVPEPGTFALVAAGLLAVWRRRYYRHCTTAA